MKVKILKCADDACEECKSMVGQVVDTEYIDHPLHPNCRCDCEMVVEAANEAPDGQAADDAIAETIDEKHIDENNEVDVQVSVVGEIMGSDKDGNPKPQTIDEASLKAIADNLNAESKEVLVDIDHQSSKDGLDRSTKAAGWLSKFWTSTKGLFAKLKLTPSGRQLVEGREYRKLSPVFQLDKDSKPTGLLSVAMTNTPAMQDIEPILNQKPNQETTEMTKEEIIELVKATFAEMKAAEEKPEDKPEEKAEEPKAEEQKPEAANACGKEEDKPEDKPEDEAKNAEPEPDKSEKPKAKKDEVIKEAVLNQMPTTANATVTEEWRTLHGEALHKWLYKNGLI